MRVGEARRDASSKIRGFIYQDLVAIEYLFSDECESNFYIEWVEDIFIENQTDLSLIQVKYYPKGMVKFEEIYEDMFYQFTKYKLIGNQKNINFTCLHYSSSTFDQEDCRNQLLKKTSNEIIGKSDLSEIWVEHDRLGNFESRKNYLISELGCSQLVNEFDLAVVKSDNFTNLRERIGEKLVDSIPNLGVITTLERSKVKAILLACVVEFIQGKYKTNNNEIDNRVIRKNELVSYIINLVNGIEVKVELIESVFLECVDELFDELMEYKDEYDDAILSWYRDLYFETKKLYMEKLKSKLNRFLFINTVCTDKSSMELNQDIYSKFSILDEWKLFLENKEKIKVHILYMWKLLFNEKFDESVDLSEHVVISSNGFMFNLKTEPLSPIFLSTEVLRTRKSHDVTHTILRIEKNEPKPIKWYMGIGGEQMTIFDYSYEINNVRSALKDGFYEVNDISQNQFIMECMSCLKCSISDIELGEKEDLKCSICAHTCVGGK